MSTLLDALSRQPVLIAAVSAALAACVTHQTGWIGAGVIASSVALSCSFACPTRAILWAIPAALGALPAYSPKLETGPRAGPVRVDAVVTDVRRRNGAQLLTCQAGLSRFFCSFDGSLDQPPAIGDRLRGVGRWVAAPEAGMPRCILAADACQFLTGSHPSTRFLAAIRNAVLRSIQRHVNGPASSLVCHLVLNTGPPLDEALRAAHRATGLAHLLAVSGAHASILGALLAVAVARGGRSPVHHRGFRWFGSAFLALYGILTGLEPPVVRAVLMFVLVVYATANGRRTQLGTALAFPTLITALVAPGDLFSVSFCLSYAAVFGLGLSGAFGGERWATRFVFVPLKASFWATLTTTPLTLLYFGQLAPWTILATPILGPLIGVLLAGGLLLSPLDWLLPPLAAGTGHGLQWLADAYSAAVLALDHAPGTPVRAIAMPGTLEWVAASLFATAAVCTWRSRGGVAVACCLLSIPYWIPRAPDRDRLSLLSVGHGQAAVLEPVNGRVTVIDCGSGRHPQHAVRAVLATLRRRRVIDRLVVTHGDADHAGGVVPLTRRVPVVELIAPAEWLASPVGRTASAAVETAIGLEHGQRVELADGWTLVRAANPATRNDGSIWIRLPFGGGHAVLPADALDQSILQVLGQPNAHGVTDPAALLLLPHHGRPIGHLPELLDAVQPELALVSNARRTTPCSQAIACRRRGIPVWETGRRGSIVIEASDPAKPPQWTVRSEQPLRIAVRPPDRPPPPGSPR